MYQVKRNINDRNNTLYGVRDLKDLEFLVQLLGATSCPLEGRLQNHFSFVFVWWYRRPNSKGIRRSIINCDKHCRICAKHKLGIRGAKFGISKLFFCCCRSLAPSNSGFTLVYVNFNSVFKTTSLLYEKVILPTDNVILEILLLIVFVQL